jgi:hypothetical protein
MVPLQYQPTETIPAHAPASPFRGTATANAFVWCSATIEAAKKEALVGARQIQAGMQHLTDLKPHERDTFTTARDLADKAGLPLVAAMEDYLPVRERGGTESLAAMATQNAKHFGPVVLHATLT